jgi:hypothetical protein
MPTQHKNPDSPVKQPERKSARPGLPHEHDESSDSQGGPKHGVIKQAHDDIVSGKKDTDLHGMPGLDKPTK